MLRNLASITMLDQISRYVYEDGKRRTSTVVEDVRIERHRTAMVSEITVQRFEVRVGALAGHESQLHELAGGVVDEHQQGAGIAALLKPAMVTPIDLDQFAVTLAPQSGLVERPSLLRDSHRPSAIIHRRSVSRPTRRSCFSSSTSVASVGPKSAYLVLEPVSNFR
jgi:hypothetical protein